METLLPLNGKNVSAHQMECKYQLVVELMIKHPYHCGLRYINNYSRCRFGRLPKSALLYFEKLHLIYCDFSLLIRTFARKFYLHGCAISAVAGK